MLRRFLLAARTTDVNELQIVLYIRQPIACMALTYRHSNYLMEDNILHTTLLIGYREPAADEKSVLTQAYEY